MSVNDSVKTSRGSTLLLLKHPAIWAFAVCWITAMAYMLWEFGLCEAVTVWSGRFVVVLLFCWLTTLITEIPPDDDEIKDATWKLWVTLALLALVVLSGWLPWWTLPGAAHVADLAGTAAEQIGLPYHYGRNPAAYCLVPLLLLLPLTGFRYLGLRRGHRTWRVVALWCTIPLLSLLGAILSGSLALGKCLQAVIGNTMLNGPWEEFLWRGALQTRLVMLLGTPWGIVLASLLFGVGHLGAQMEHSGGNLAVALARTIIMQSVTGLAFGVIYWRTRNLAASSICHVVFNTVID